MTLLKSHGCLCNHGTNDKEFMTFEATRTKHFFLYPTAIFSRRIVADLPKPRSLKHFIYVWIGKAQWSKSVLMQSHSQGEGSQIKKCEQQIVVYNDWCCYVTMALNQLRLVKCNLVTCISMRLKCNELGWVLIHLHLGDAVDEIWWLDFTIAYTVHVKWRILHVPWRFPLWYIWSGFISCQITHKTYLKSVLSG